MARSAARSRAPKSRPSRAGSLRLWWPALAGLLLLAGGALLLGRLLPAGAAAPARPAAPTFRLTNQQNEPIRNATFAGRLYVTDFFFATCPDVCPRMQQQLARVYTRYRDDPRVALLSHTIDPAHDSLPVLRDYARRLGVPDARQWHFATAPHDTIFALARAYLTTAGHAGLGSLVHSGTLALVDAQGRLVDTYDGLNPTDVDRLLDRLEEELATLPAQ